jgi:hypothetical protein
MPDDDRKEKLGCLKIESGRERGGAANALNPSSLWGGWIAKRSAGEPGGVMHEDPTLLLANARSFPPHKGEGEKCGAV